VAYNGAGTFPNGWLSFELSVLARRRFASIALPITGEPDLCLHLKRRQVRIAANDQMQWSYLKATALIENSDQQLTEDDIELVLADSYGPGEELDNPALAKWFNPIDTWWFDNVRRNILQLDSHYKRALAFTAAMGVGDYVLSFDSETLKLRSPFALPDFFRRLLQALPRPFDNTLRHQSSNQDIRDFIAERHYIDLLFLRLPAPAIHAAPARDPFLCWREEWLRGNDGFWPEVEGDSASRLGWRVQSKQQYLRFVEDLLQRAAHIPAWAVAFTENGFISSEELTETVNEIRTVKAVYTKDFSDLLGVRASILTA
jgi:hypothetical protein